MTSSTPLLSSSTDTSYSESLTLELPSGRTLGYARYGAPESPHPTTIYLHGYPSTRIEAAMYHSSLVSSNLQLVAVDRPGFGLSSPIADRPLSSRTILDFVDDIIDVADHLNLSTFNVLGISGGAPYALALTYKHPERLIGVGIVAGLGPYVFHTSKAVWSQLYWLNKIGLILPMKIPWLYERAYGLIVPWLVRRMCSKSYSEVINDASFRKYAAETPDGKLLLDGGEEFYDANVRNIHEAIRQHGFAKSHVEEARLLAKKWPFEVAEVRHQNIRLYYGTSDVNTPLAAGEMLHQALGGDRVAKLVILDEGTHATVTANGVEWIRELLEIEDQGV